MGFANELFEGVGKAFIFERVRPGLRNYLARAGIADVPYGFMGLLFWLSILPVSYLFIFNFWGLVLDATRNPLLQFILAVFAWTALHGAVLAGILVVVYIYLDLRMPARTRSEKHTS